MQVGDEGERLRRQDVDGGRGGQLDPAWLSCADCRRPGHAGCAYDPRVESDVDRPGRSHGRVRGLRPRWRSVHVEQRRSRDRFEGHSGCGGAPHPRCPGAGLRSRIAISMVVAGKTAWICSGSAPALAVPCATPAGMKMTVPGPTRRASSPRRVSATPARIVIASSTFVSVERDGVAGRDLLGDDRERLDAPSFVAGVDLEPPARCSADDRRGRQPWPRGPGFNDAHPLLTRPVTAVGAWLSHEG